MKTDDDLIKIRYEVEECSDYFMVAVEDFSGMTDEQIRVSLQDQIDDAVRDSVAGYCENIDAIVEKIAASLARSEAA